jgi:hypothetical protein
MSSVILNETEVYWNTSDTALLYWIYRVNFEPIVFVEFVFYSSISFLFLSARTNNHKPRKMCVFPVALDKSSSFVGSPFESSWEGM